MNRLDISDLCFIDIETLSTAENAVITEVGLVAFDSERNLNILMDSRLDINKQQNRDMEHSTVRFRLEQVAGNPQLADKLVGESELSITLVALKKLLVNYKYVVAWGSMDQMVLEHAYRQLAGDNDPQRAHLAHHRKWINARAWSVTSPDSFIKPKQVVHAAVADAAWLAEATLHMLEKL